MTNQGSEHAALQSLLDQLSQGSIPEDFDDLDERFPRYGDSVRGLLNSLRSTVSQADAVARGDYSGEFTPRSDEDNLGIALTEMTLTLSNIANVASSVSQGDFSPRLRVKGQQDLLAPAINAMIESFASTALQIDTIAQGDYSAEIEPASPDDTLGVALFEMTRTLRDVADVANAVSEGDYSRRLRVKGERDLLAPAVNRMLESLSSAVDQATQVASGDYSATIEPRSESDALGHALAMMTRELRQARATTEHKAWLLSSLSELQEVMLQESDAEMLGDRILSYLGPRLGAHVGALYVHDLQHQCLRVAGTRALSTGVVRGDTISMGEGIVGQVAREQKPLRLGGLSDQHLRVQSSVISAMPTEVLVHPLMVGERLAGVVEFAALGGISDAAVELLDFCAESIGITLEASIVRQQVDRLLSETQALAEELQQQQIELMASNTELEQQRTQLQASQQKLEQQQRDLEVSNKQLQQNNEELEIKTRLVDQQNDELEQTRQELQVRVDDLALASRYKSEFLANMSHELRTPLNSMLLLARFLSENGQGNMTEQQVEAATVVHKSGNDLLHLINEILDLAKIEAGRMSVTWADCSTTELAERLITTHDHMAEDKGLQLTISTDFSGKFRSDAGRVEQILHNLLANAIKFTDEGTVDVGFHLATPSEHPLDKDQEVMAVVVKDTGIGIPADMHEGIFEAFQQVEGGVRRRHGGTGLGLAISNELATLLGGALELTSSGDQGSCFTLFLPLSPTAAATTPSRPTPRNQAATPKARRARPTPAAARRLKAPNAAPVPPGDDRDELESEARVILVIEDDVAFAKVVRDLCREYGFKVLLATTGEEGVALALERQPSGILLDIGLPGMDGWSVIDALKDNPRTRHIPVHFVSVEDETLDAMRRGAVGYLQKPATLEGLHEALDRLEGMFGRKVKELLIIEDDPSMRMAIRTLLGNGDLVTTDADSGGAALELLQQRRFDCVVLDIGLPDMSGFDLLRRLQSIVEPMPPIIVYTGRELSEQDAAELRFYAESIIIKGVRSEERLLDETAIFLHRIVDNMAPPQQRIIESLRGEDTVLEDKRVLLVDDDMRNAFALSHVLTQRGMHVTKAENGQVALDKLKEENFDIVLMDIMMPVMDGFETMRQIRSQPKYSNLPVIALTAKAMREDRDKCIEAGANDYLTKPVELDRLVSVMRVWLYR